MPGPDSSQLLFNGPVHAPATVALAHGAGAGMDTPFMEFFARGLAEKGYRVVRFEFPYIAQRRQGGTKRPPDREAVLRQTWLDVVGQLSAERLVIGGKSLGGRIASMIADEVSAAGLVCLGYPFHPTGKSAQPPVAHLKNLKTLTLILQGTRDSLGNADEVRDYPLSPAIRLHWLADGDHSFKPRRASGRTEAENWEGALAALRTFLDELLHPA